MTALEMAKDIVRLIEEMNRNGFSFYNKTLRNLRVLHEDITAEVKTPPQEREAHELDAGGLDAREHRRWKKVEAVMDHIHAETAKLENEDEYRFVLAQILLNTSMKLNYALQTPVLKADLGLQTRTATVDMPPENCA